jgi:hypothetical protein
MMKFIVLCFFLCQLPVGAKDLFSFVSYNIRLSGLDESGHQWKDRMQPVSAILSGHDIAAIQEISHEQFLDLRQLNPQLSAVGINSVTGKNLAEPAVFTVEGMAIFYNTDKFDLLEAQNYWFSDTPNQPSQHWGRWKTSFPKMVQICLFQDKQTGKKLALFNSHYCHEDPPYGVFNPRLASAKFELLKIKEFRQQGYAIISAGDRNTHLPRDQQVLEMFESENDLVDADDYRIGLNATFIGYQDHPRANIILGDGSMKNSINLDKVYVSAGLDIIQAEVISGLYNEVGELVQDNGNSTLLQDLRNKRLYASDHAAYQLQLKFAG